MRVVFVPRSVEIQPLFYDLTRSLSLSKREGSNVVQQLVGKLLSPWEKKLNKKSAKSWGKKIEKNPRKKLSPLEGKKFGGKKMPAL